jgi:hypothetical protein
VGAVSSRHPLIVGPRNALSRRVFFSQTM